MVAAPSGVYPPEAPKSTFALLEGLTALVDLPA